MKKVMKKISDILKTIYGYGIAFCLFAGGATVIGYLAALVIGGETAAAICTFLYKTALHDLILAAGCFVLLGLLAMYLSGESSMKLDKKKKVDESSKDMIKERF